MNIFEKYTLNNSSDPVLLMCEPAFYGIPAPDAEMGHANIQAGKHYREYLKDPKEYTKGAQRQWKDLKNIFNERGLQTREIEPKEGMLDLVFTADPSLSLITVPHKEALYASPHEITISSPHEITILSNFNNRQRQNEVDENAKYIEESFSGRSIIRSYYRTEGTGDNVYDSFRDVFWSGYLPAIEQNGKPCDGRTDIRAHTVLREITGVDVISMNVCGIDRGFFHVDTSMAPLSKGHILCYRDGMSEEAYHKIITQGLAAYGLPLYEYLIEISQADAHNFACNLRSIGDTLIMPLCSEGLQDRLKKAGYEVITTDMSHFIGNGGAMHCVTNNLNEQRVAGGTCGQYGFGFQQPKAAMI